MYLIRCIFIFVNKGKKAKKTKLKPLGNYLHYNSKNLYYP